MKTFSQVFALFLFAIFSLQLSAQCCSAAKTASCCNSESWDGHRPDSHAPIGVMGDHYHHKSGLMVSYRYMYMKMEGNLAGSNEVENPFIFQNYMLAPQIMSMQMHMPGIMYAPTERLTLMVMSNYIINEMDLLAMDGMGHDMALRDSTSTFLLGYLKT